MLRPRARFFLMLLCGLAAAAVLFAWHRPWSAPKGNTEFGVTFSTLYAKELGLDWKAAFVAALDDLGVRRFRLPVYWNAVERSPGVYDWSEVDWMLEEAAAREAKVILAVGRKTPRWPECHVPAWAASLPPEEQDARLMEFLAAEIERYKGMPVVERWQVENEPLFRFGICPPPDAEMLEREITLVRERDARPIMVTDSGELSSWVRAGHRADVLGISLYRFVWNEHLRWLYWPVHPAFYSDRMRAFESVLGKVLISELQAEPWFHEPIQETPIEAQLRQMNADRLRANIRFASATGASEAYLWGVEWWYWISRQGHPELWEAAKEAF